MTAKPPTEPPTPPSPAAPTLLQRWYPGLRVAACTPLRLAGMVPVLMVLSMIVLAYITAVPSTLLPLLPRHRVAVTPLLLVFHFIYANVLANYLLLVLLDPGSPPPSWSAPPPPRPRPRTPLAEARQLAEQHRLRGRTTADDDDAETLLLPPRPAPAKPAFAFAHLMHERSYDGTLRYCRVCSAYKPDRAHHCSVCRRCILRMDHHCVFVNNCVSFYNHKFFVSFVLYAFLGCIFVTLTSLPTFVAIVSAVDVRPSSITESGGTREPALARNLFRDFAAIEQLSPLMKTLAMVGYITSAAFSVALVIFVGLHLYLVSKGRTTIEMYELTDPTRATRVLEYDLGPAKNCRNVFGAVPMCWFFPTRAYVDGDGLDWERRISSSSHDFNV